MPLSRFHPVIQEWFKATFSAPSPPQAAGYPHICAGRDTLICAPTGSGKTLTAFLACLDSLFRQGINGSLPFDGIQVVYVSPLKALSNDIEKNLRQPLEGIYATAHARGIIAPEIRVGVRTGDTRTSDRQSMLRQPPHILVTTPESLFILLTAKRSRELFRSVRTVIIDEIHALARDKRGAHLALSLERLDALCPKPPQRIGLSATQRPVELVARFLCGSARVNPDGTPACAIVDLGHLRKLELSIEIPGSPLQPVCSHETWEEVYERLTALIQAHRTTLIFVNTRRMCERLAQHLTKRLGEDKVTSHHGSLSRTQRLDAETRLKEGSLSALVATASLELGIDIGHVDLVCQVGVTHSIGTLLQRIGRSGHSLTGTSRGKLFALTIDELCSAAALSGCINSRTMDILQIPDKPLDILAQQIVAASASEDWNEDALYELCRRAYNYRDLSRAEFDEVVQTLAEGFRGPRGRAAALIHYDGVGQRICGRRGARLAAITSGGAIPDNADFQVIQEPQGIVVGTLNEDFAVESTPGDIFQLGNTSWKILKVEPGKVRVQDAHGQPPSIPFWLGEAPGRSDQLSQEISRLRQAVEDRLAAAERDGTGNEPVIAWISSEYGIDTPAADQLCTYLAESRKALGVLPTLDTLVLERFFDESGGMQLVVHTPFGRRVNWAWGLALRKRFCRGFNFELQAAASENSILLSLGPQHSFPLADVFHYLHPNSVEKLLIQAALEAPVFQTRWRWDACRALALLRFNGGKKVPAALMRMRADDLLAGIFPHAAACPENLEGDREIPDHPLVREVIHDCLHEAMDIDGLMSVLKKIHAGEMCLVARDTVEPSALATEILTAKPYSFLDDAPLEERRTQAVFMRRGGSDANVIGALDADAIARVRDEVRPTPQDADELHDTFMLVGCLTEHEAEACPQLLAELTRNGRATSFTPPGTQTVLWTATERVPLIEAIHPDINFAPAVQVPAKERAREWTPESALVELVRGRLEILGPVTVQALAQQLGLPASQVEQAMIALETKGTAIRGRFSTLGEIEWCDRRLLARIHRYTLDRLRKEIEPVTASDYMRFLFSWQHADPDTNADGVHGLREIIGQLQGCEVSAISIERDVLPIRMKQYDRRWLDQLSLSGDLTWGRRFLAPRQEGDDSRRTSQVRHAPIGLFLREHLDCWLALAPKLAEDETPFSGAAREVLQLLRKRGAVFFQNMVRETRRLPAEIESALGELVAAGFVTCDGFSGLRALLKPASKRSQVSRRRARYANLYTKPGVGHSDSSRDSGIQSAGRWSLFRGDGADNLFGRITEDEMIEAVAKQLLRRWGVVFHRVLYRESGLPPWRDILRVYRRMEARGELRGGRFVAGFSGEQYALPEAVEHLRMLRKKPSSGKLLNISGADPLNLAGIITPGDRVPARGSARIIYRDGTPVAIKEAKEVRILERDPAPSVSRAIYAALIRKAM